MQLAVDHRDAVGAPPLTIERIVREAVGGIAAELWAGRRRPTSAEQRILDELAAWGTGPADGSRRLVEKAQRMRRGVIKRRGGR